MGYLYKRVSLAPQWLNTPAVTDVYALSGCISANFADYVNFWRHNGYWLFDSPDAIHALAKEQSISLAGTTLFYYEVHDVQYDDMSGQWVAFEAEPSIPTQVQAPAAAAQEGFDVTSFHAGASAECSPLSCNGLAADIATNAHCLFPTLEAAVRALEEGRFRNTEPGPYRIVGVYSVRET